MTNDSVTPSSSAKFFTQGLSLIEGKYWIQPGKDRFGILVTKKREWVDLSELSFFILKKLSESSITTNEIIRLSKNHFKDIDEGYIRKTINYFKKLEFISEKPCTLKVYQRRCSNGFYNFPPLPRNISLALTYKCNLTCKHCAVDAGNSLQNELKTSTIIDFINYIAPFVHIFSLTGGEPLLHQDFPIILEHSLKSDITPHISTNATLLTRTKAVEIEGMGLNRIQISLDGIKDIHNHIRGDNSFKKTINGIKNAVKAGMSVQICTVIMKSNLENIEDIIKLCIDLKVEQWRCQFIDNVGRAISYNQSITSSEIKCAVENISKLKKKYKNEIEIIIPNYSREFAPFLKNPKFLGRSYCPAGFAFIYISANGDVYPCEKFPSLKSYVLGNIKNKKLSDIWENSLILDILRNRDIKSVVGKCSRCSHLGSACYGACVVRNISRYNNIIDPMKRLIKACYSDEIHCWKEV